MVCHLESGISGNPETKRGKIPAPVLEQRSVTCDPLDCKERKRCVHGLDPPAVLVNEAFSRAGGREGGTRWERSTTSVDLFVFPALHTMATTCAGHGWAQEAIRKRVRPAGGW